MSHSTIIVGDCLETMRAMPNASVHAIVTDPPYGISFMGKGWDSDVPPTAIWSECLRVLKPGGHLLSFAGTRTQHRMATRIEEAGFEIRDVIAWVYGSGFPKSLDVSKAIDKAAGAEREVIGPKVYGDGHVQNNSQSRNQSGRYNFTMRDGVDPNPLLTAPATEAARQWQGWGTALKPAMEPITVARKPLVGTVAENVLAHGTGGVNVDGCMVGEEATVTRHTAKVGSLPGWSPKATGEVTEHVGRWPANLIHDGSPDAIAPFPGSSATGTLFGEGDPEGAARFFYCAKPSRAERGDNSHPTVKPIALMRYLCRLVTPKGGTVLDPFAGSGTTGVAAIAEGFHFVGCELSEDYAAIARKRLGSYGSTIPPTERQASAHTPPPAPTV